VNFCTSLGGQPFCTSLGARSFPAVGKGRQLTLPFGRPVLSRSWKGPATTKSLAAFSAIIWSVRSGIPVLLTNF
jgi:hypothetical protein